MSFTIHLQPANRSFEVQRDEPILSAAIRQGIGLPYGCRDGACGSCKSRLLEGRVIHGAHQLQALSAAEEDAGLILTCCAAPQTDCVIEARSVPGAGEFPVLKMPARVLSLQRAAPDVVILKLQLPANQNLQYRAGQYVEFILRDGARRSYSMANAPHNLGSPPALELHLRHMPGGKFTDHVFGAMKEKEILRIEGPFGSFFLREDIDQADRAAGRGHRLRADQGADRAHAAQGHRRGRRCCTGAAAAAPTCTCTTGPKAAARRCRTCATCRCCPRASTETAGPAAPAWCTSAVMDDLPDLSGHQVYACGAPVMVESAQRRFRRALRPAGRRVLRRRLHLRGRQAPRRMTRAPQPIA